MTALGAMGYGFGAIGQIYGAINSYQSGVAQQEAADQAAQAAITASQIQANAVTAQAEREAAEYQRQARLEETRAGIEQIQGEQEAEKRSRLLAANVGSLYANYAGNGLLVDGRHSDTLGAALRTTVAEGQADISTIRDNTAMNVWTRQTNAASLRQSAANTIASGNETAYAALYSGLSDAKSYRNQGKLAYRSGVAGMVTGLLGAGSSASLGTVSTADTYSKYGTNWWSKKST